MGIKYFFKTKGGLYRKLVSSSLAAVFTASAFSSGISNAANQTIVEKIVIPSWEKIKKHKKLSITVVSLILIAVIGSVIVSQILREKSANTQTGKNDVQKENNDQGKDENKDVNEEKEKSESQNEENEEKNKNKDQDGKGNTVEEKKEESTNGQGKVTFNKTKAIKIGAVTGAGTVIGSGTAFTANNLMRKSEKKSNASDNNKTEGTNQNIGTSVQSEKKKEKTESTNNLLSDNSNADDTTTANNKVPNQDDVGQEPDNSNNEVESLATETEGDEVIGTLDSLKEDETTNDGTDEDNT